MACMYPILIDNPNVEMDLSGNAKMLVPCGKCENCIKLRRMHWSIRLQEENKVSLNSWFVTLTYNDQHLPVKDGYVTLRKNDLQKYFKRLRHDNNKLKYYGVGEYGGKLYRPHYHAIVFNADPLSIVDKWSDKNGDIGNVKIGNVSDASINYVSGYIINKIHYASDKIQNPFAIMSKGLGKAFTENSRGFYREQNDYTYISKGGVRNSLPRYYRERIWNEAERKEISDRNKERMKKEVEEIFYDEELNKRESIRYKFKKSKK